MSIVLKGISDQDRAKQKDLSPAVEHEAKFAKKPGTTAADAKQALKDWQKSQREPKPAKNPDVSIKAVQPTAANIEKLVAVANSDQAPQEIINQKLDEQAFFGTAFSATSVYEFIKMQGEYAKRKASRTTAAKADSEWAQVVKGAQSAFASAGLNITEAQLTSSAKDLAGNKRQLETIARIANSRVAKKDNIVNLAPAAGVAAKELDVSLAGAFTAATAMIIDPNLFTVTIPNLCSKPFAEGIFTKHWTHSWSLTITYPYWCPIWSNPFRICYATATIASVSVDVGLNVGYRVNCCGATAWGQAWAQACGTIAGITKCVGCTATVVGVAGFSRTPVGTQCSYGLGINASIVCQVFGATVFSATWSFGYTVMGPCPPAGFIC